MTDHLNMTVREYLDSLLKSGNITNSAFMALLKYEYLDLLDLWDKGAIGRHLEDQKATANVIHCMEVLMDYYGVSY